MTDWYSAVGMFLRLASSWRRASTLFPAGGLGFRAWRLPRQRMEDADGPADVQALPQPTRGRGPRVQGEPVRLVPRSEGLHGVAAHLRRARDLGPELPVRAAETE